MSEDHQHESPIKTPKQLITVVVLSFAVPIALIVLLVSYVTGGKRIDGQGLAVKPESVAERIKPVAAVNLKAADGPKTFLTGEQVYQQVCKACHEAGVAGAHKFGDKAAWAPHLKEGYEALLKNAISGIRAMPPRGGNADLSDFEVGRALVHMANASGGSFKEPAAPAQATAPAAAPAAAAAAPAAAPAVAAAPAAPSAPAKADGKSLYDASCQACHAAGVAGAPKFGDKAAWAPRIKTGMDALYGSAIKGKGAMPPKGAAASASDGDIKAAVDYMVAAAK